MAAFHLVLFLSCAVSPVCIFGKQNDLSTHPSSPADEVCQSILEVTSSSTEPDCQPLGDCTGLSCYSSTSNKTVEIAVNKCTDPLVVNVTVYDGMEGSTVYVTRQVTGVGDIIADAIHYKVNAFKRDLFMLAISVSYFFDDVFILAVPTTKIPLNSSICMCESLKKVPLFESCHINKDCTGHHCQLFNSKLLLSSELDPCRNPAEIIFTVSEVGSRDLKLSWKKSFVKSEEALILDTYLLNVTMTQMKYSITVHAVIFDDHKNSFEVIPKTQFILDYTQCIYPPYNDHTHISSSNHISSDKNQPLSFKTCDALKAIKDAINKNELVSCELNAECNTLSCEAKQYYVTFTLLPCLDPPSFHVIAKADEDTIFEGVIDETTSIPIMTMAKFIITLKHDEVDSSLNIKLNIKFGFSEYPVLPDTVIPIDKCQCASAECTGPELGSEPLSLLSVTPNPSPNKNDGHDKAEL